MTQVDYSMRWIYGTCQEIRCGNNCEMLVKGGKNHCGNKPTKKRNSTPTLRKNISPLFSLMLQFTSFFPMVSTVIVRIPLINKPTLPSKVKKASKRERFASPLQRDKCTGNPASKGIPATEKQLRIRLAETLGIWRANPCTVLNFRASAPGASFALYIAESASPPPPIPRARGSNNVKNNGSPLFTVMANNEIPISVMHAYPRMRPRWR